MKTRRPRSPIEAEIPLLKAGDRLTREEFERRYEAMPNVNKAELSEGVVQRQTSLHEHLTPRSQTYTSFPNSRLGMPVVQTPVCRPNSRFGVLFLIAWRRIERHTWMPVPPRGWPCRRRPTRKIKVAIQNLLSASWAWARRGTALAMAFQQQAGVDVAYVCDADQGRAERAAAAVQKTGNP